MIYIVGVLFGFWLYYEPAQPWFKRTGGFLVLWILVGIIGWRVFGPAVHG
jgi:hypothetical protein